MSHVAILPSIFQPYTDKCMASLSPTFGQVAIVDNTVKNNGVARSWNIGIDYALGLGRDWLIIMSAACRFGLEGGMDFIDALDQHPDAVAIEADRGVGWHLIAFNRKTLEKVGRFDENFYPAYNEDVDYGRRIALAYDLEPPYWPKVNVQVQVESIGHGVELGGAKADPDEMKMYLHNKWGGPKGHETFTHPFNLSFRGIDWWPEPDVYRANRHLWTP